MKWRAALDSALEHLGLTQAKYSVLASLRSMTWDGESPTQRQLADHTGLDAIYISKLVKSLEQSELIERIPDPLDSRAVRLTLTDDGIEVIDQAVLIVADLLEDLTEPIGGAESRRSHQLMRDLGLLIDSPPVAKDVKRKETK